MKEWIFNVGWEIRELPLRLWESLKEAPENGVMILMGIIAGTAFAISLMIAKRDDKYFKENKRETVGRVEGFAWSDSGSQRHPMVSFVDENGELKEMSAFSNGKCWPDYPQYAPIHITYLIKYHFGIEFYVVRVSEPGYEPPNPQIAYWMLRVPCIGFYLLMVWGIYRMFRGI